MRVYKCDRCGKYVVIKEKCLFVWTTEQTEGRSCEPYYGTELLDLCDECPERIHVMEAACAQGLNRYVFRKEVVE